jgi:primosomal protein N''
MRIKTFIVLLFASLPAFAQFNEKAFNQRGEQNKAVCEEAARTVSVNHPGEVMAAMQAARSACLQERELSQYFATMELCQRASPRKASSNVSVKAFYKKCMNEHGYEVAE